MDVDRCSVDKVEINCDAEIRHAPSARQRQSLPTAAQQKLPDNSKRADRLLKSRAVNERQSQVSVAPW